MVVLIVTRSRPIATNEPMEEAGHYFGVTPSQITQVSSVSKTLSPRVHLGQLVTLTFECPQRFHLARRIMRQ